MNPLRKLPLLPALALLGLGALTWFGLRPARIPAAWLTVDAPRVATVGQTLVLRVTTNAATPAGLISADLHWSTPWHDPRGFLSGAAAQPVGTPGSTLTFRLAVPPRDDLGEVRAVVYAGPTHRWQDQIAAVTSNPIPVVSAAARSPSDTESRSLAVFDERPDPAAVRHDDPVVQGAVAMLWMICAMRWWTRRNAGGAETARSAWRVPAATCLAAAVWEALPAEQMIGEVARAFAIGHHWYGARVGFQTVLTGVVVMATAGLIARVWARERDRARRWTWLGLGGYAGLALASLLSHHDVDALLAKPVGGMSTLQLGQLAATGLAVVGSWRARA